MKPFTVTLGLGKALSFFLSRAPEIGSAPAALQDELFNIPTGGPEVYPWSAAVSNYLFAVALAPSVAANGGEEAFALHMGLTAPGRKWLRDLLSGMHALAVVGHGSPAQTKHTCVVDGFNLDVSLRGGLLEAQISLIPDADDFERGERFRGARLKDTSGALGIDWGSSYYGRSSITGVPHTVSSGSPLRLVQSDTHSDTRSPAAQPTEKPKPVLQQDGLPYTGRRRENIVEHNRRGNVLVIGDTHIPFELPGYLDFCQRVRDHYACETVVHIGDEVDQHAHSYHEHDPDGLSAGHEHSLALKRLKAWYGAFPEVVVTRGNHTELAFRKAFSAGLASTWMRSYNEVYEAPASWRWVDTYERNGVRFIHGQSLKGGQKAPLIHAQAMHRSVVMGHLHRNCATYYSVTPGRTLFGAFSGCGIDPEAYAMRYGAEGVWEFAHGCLVLLEDGTLPLFVPMEGPHDRHPALGRAA